MYKQFIHVTTVLLKFEKSGEQYILIHFHCARLIIITFINQVWDLFHQAEKVRAMLTRLIKEEALRTYLFTYSHVYDSISMPKLADMFQLKRPVVHSIISKMIINEELMVLRKYTSFLYIN